jgi:hypothetical protein
LSKFYCKPQNNTVTAFNVLYFTKCRGLKQNNSPRENFMFGKRSILIKGIKASAITLPDVFFSLLTNFA